MNKALLKATLFLVVIVLVGCRENESLHYEKKSFNSDWLFFLVEDEVSEEQFIQPDFDDSGWERVTLPHTPRLEALVVNDQWQGTCWYRKNFNIPRELKQKKLYLSFEGAMNVADVWINGSHKINHMGGYLPFVIEFSDEARFNGSNHMLVRLDNRDNPNTGPKPLEILDFNTYGGIYRNVWFFAKDPLHISDPILADKEAGGGVFVTFPVVSPGSATISVQTHVINDHRQEESFVITNSLYKDGVMVLKAEGANQRLSSGGDGVFCHEMEVKDPDLWSPQHPQLYLLETVLLQGDRIVDKEETRIGIKSMSFKGQDFYLNGEQLFLRGVNRHQEYPFVGYALSDQAQYRDAKKIKEAGFDYVRLSHYPHSSAFMDACDELGIMTVDAILGWQYYSDSSDFQKHVYHCVRDLIRRDRNHASVLAWEVSLNESWMPESFIDSLHQMAHREYPGDQCFTAGWQEYGYDIYLQARQHRLNHLYRGAKPYLVSEYGDWEYYAMNAGLNQDLWDGLLQEERTSRQLRRDGAMRLLQQARNIQEAHNDNFTTPAFADAYWVMFDYNRGYADDLEASGIMDIFRIPKPAFYFFQSQRDASDPYGEPMVHIASALRENNKGVIRVFSNCDEVELILNGSSLGRQAPDHDQFSNHLAHPPFTFDASSYRSGELRAQAYLNGELAAEAVQYPAGKASKIQLVADLSGKNLQSGSNDLIFIYASLLDESGTLVPDHDQNISFSLAGDAWFMGPNPAPTEAGIATILLRAGKDSGLIKVTASSSGLSSNTMQLETEPIRQGLSYDF